MNDETKRGVDAIMRLRDCDLAPVLTRAVFIAGLLKESDMGLTYPPRRTPLGPKPTEVGRE